ncbi:hypothetical protein [Cohnella sp. GbtcB17]|uniref:hypothetical protein n=1 Tax=Cohnella sp. GbtcB17 TaxID=2824762 RepID=UPI001C2F998D|nr:hypothetical protein [Cohnella sp. GbtcB17]
MKVPGVLDGARVIEYTMNSVENQFGVVGILSDKGNVIDELQITAMAICQYEEANKFYLFSCDLNWEVIGDFDFSTVEEAKTSAKQNHHVDDDDWFLYNTGR